MKKSVEQTLKTQGYQPIFNSILATKKSLLSLKYTLSEIKESLKESYSDNGGIIDAFISKNTF